VLIIVAATAVILVATIIQWLTGTGFALVATPLLVLLYDATQGVILTILLEFIVSVAMLVRPQAKVDWNRTLKLLGAAVLFSPIGFLLVFLLPDSWLMLVVSAAAALSLYSGLRHRTPASTHAGAPSLIFAGASSGILHVTSGLSGPPLIGYALKSKWEQTQFIVSIQVIFIGLHILTIGVRGLPAVSVQTLLTLTLAALCGIIVSLITRKLFSTTFIKYAMITIAWTGTIAVFVRAVIQLLMQ
jgi:uncharacterized membrane protein YfcA